MLTGEQYVKLLSTHSSYRALEERTREELFVGILAVIEQFGGMIERPYLALLFHAHVK